MQVGDGRKEIIKICICTCQSTSTLPVTFFLQRFVLYDKVLQQFFRNLDIYVNIFILDFMFNTLVCYICFTGTTSKNLIKFKIFLKN